MVHPMKSNRTFGSRRSRVPDERPLRVAIIGDRGIPARYSGFSTLVEELAKGLVKDFGMDVTVYCRKHYYEEHPATFEGVKCRWLPAPGGKSFESIVHSNLAIFDASLKDFDVAFVVDPGNGPFLIPLRARGVPVLLHTDGLGWQRQKWGKAQKAYYKWSEGVSAKLADWLVTDSRAMQSYYLENYSAPSTYVPYSGEVGDRPDFSALAKHGVEPGKFALVVARMEPENNVHPIIQDYRRAELDIPLIVVGSTPYGGAYSQKVDAENDGHIRCVGGVFDSAELNALYANCAIYIHGHEVGGTNPSLLRAMHHGAPCLPIDVPFHRENLPEGNPFFSKQEGHLAGLLRELLAEPDRCESLGKAAHLRERRAFRWDAVVDGYAEVFKRMVAAKQSRSGMTMQTIGETYRPGEFFERSEA